MLKMKRCVLMLFLLMAGGWSWNVQAACSASAQSVPFGNYNPFSLTATDATGTVTVTCTGISLLVSYTIKLSTGTSGSFTTRTMKLGGTSFNYNLYTNALRVTVWGDSTGGSFTITDGYLITLGTVNRDYSVYGRLFAQQNVAPGLYSDTILVTVEY